MITFSSWERREAAGGWAGAHLCWFGGHQTHAWGGCRYGGCGQRYPSHRCPSQSFQLVLGRGTLRGCCCSVCPRTSSAAAHTSVSAWETAVQICWRCLKLGLDHNTTLVLLSGVLMRSCYRYSQWRCFGLVFRGRFFMPGLGLGGWIWDLVTQQESPNCGLRKPHRGNWRIGTLIVLQHTDCMGW